jgi:hypothetical protein
MKAISHLASIYRVLFHGAVGFSAKVSFLFGYSLLQFNIILANAIMLFAIAMITISGYFLAAGHPRFLRARLIMIVILFIIFLAMLIEGNGWFI